MTDTFASARTALEAAIAEATETKQEAERQIDALSAALEALGLSQPTKLVAFSKGAEQAQQEKPKAKAKATVKRRKPIAYKIDNPSQPEHFSSDRVAAVARRFQAAQGHAVTQAEVGKALKISSGEMVRAVRILKGAGVLKFSHRQKSVQGPPSPAWMWVGPAGKKPETAPAPEAPKAERRETVLQPGVGLREGRLTVGA